MRFTSLLIGIICNLNFAYAFDFSDLAIQDAQLISEVKQNCKAPLRIKDEGLCSCPTDERYSIRSDNHKHTTLDQISAYYGEKILECTQNLSFQKICIGNGVYYENSRCFCFAEHKNIEFNLNQNEQTWAKQVQQCNEKYKDNHPNINPNKVFAYTAYLASIHDEGNSLSFKKRPGKNSWSDASTQPDIQGSFSHIRQVMTSFRNRFFKDSAKAQEIPSFENFFGYSHNWQDSEEIYTIPTRVFFEKKRLLWNKVVTENQRPDLVASLGFYETPGLFGASDYLRHFIHFSQLPWGKKGIFPVHDFLNHAWTTYLIEPKVVKHLRDRLLLFEKLFRFIKNLPVYPISPTLKSFCNGVPVGLITLVDQAHGNVSAFPISTAIENFGTIYYTTLNEFLEAVMSSPERKFIFDLFLAQAAEEDLKILEQKLDYTDVDFEARVKGILEFYYSHYESLKL